MRTVIFALFDRIEAFKLKDLVGFVTTGKHSQIDYYLTQLDMDLKPFDHLFLEPQFCPPKASGVKVTLKDFLFIKNIGIGGFSLVYLVKKKDTGKFYAMKLIEKDFIFKVL